VIEITRDDFAALVSDALETLPEEFREFLEEVPVEIRDRPSTRELKRSGIPRDGLLLGLYHGRPRTRRSVEDSAVMPDVIYIFQDHIQQVANSREQLIEQVRITVLHEIGHHFGMSEDDLERLGYR
jgi:predicted Zn-dependent protease with MMP-like domain